jgi:hypothetical protein
MSTWRNKKIIAITLMVAINKMKVAIASAQVVVEKMITRKITEGRKVTRSVAFKRTLIEEKIPRK